MKDVTLKVHYFLKAILLEVKTLSKKHNYRPFVALLEKLIVENLERKLEELLVSIILLATSIV